MLRIALFLTGGLLLASSAGAHHTELHTYLCPEGAETPGCSLNREGSVPPRDSAVRERTATETASYQAAWQRALTVVWYPLYEQRGARWRGAALLDACGKVIPEGVGPDEAFIDDVVELLPDITNDADPIDMAFRVMLATNSVAAGYVMDYAEAIKLMIQTGLVDRDFACTMGDALLK